PPNDTDLRRLDSDPFEWNWQGGSPESTLKYGICTRFHTGDRKCKTSWNNYVPRYTWAIIWGGLLWDVREALGADLADAIAFEAMSAARGDSETLSRAAGRLVEADLALNNGENRGRIESMAAERGVAVQTRVEASTGAPPFAVDVFPTPVASGSVSIVVRPDKPIGTLTVDILDLLGRRVAAYREPVNGLHPVTFSWPAASALPGLYFVRISGGASSTMRPVTVVR
ncbi:MAG: T9SS type A sorting domain-containing protein, partial [Rhodothermales bacterium]|nr:T9SS type A sorting domain-containing protein [Rhodothermales bacterium]